MVIIWFFLIIGKISNTNFNKCINYYFKGIQSFKLKRIDTTLGDINKTLSFNITGHNLFNVNLYTISVLKSKSTLIWKNDEFLGDPKKYFVSNVKNSGFYLTIRKIQRKDFNDLYCCSDETENHQCFELLYLYTGGIIFYLKIIF